MNHRLRAFTAYVRLFVRYLLYLREVLLGLLVLIFAGGVAISKLEGIAMGDAIYFSCVTGLTIGYGDITPTTLGGRVISVSIGLVGMTLSGLIVAVATRALADYVQQKKHVEKS